VTHEGRAKLLDFGLAKTTGVDLEATQVAGAPVHLRILGLDGKEETLGSVAGCDLSPDGRMVLGVSPEGRFQLIPAGAGPARDLDTGPGVGSASPCDCFADRGWQPARGRHSSDHGARATRAGSGGEAAWVAADHACHNRGSRSGA